MQAIVLHKVGAPENLKIEKVNSLVFPFNAPK
jgi:hypothetical protein